MTVNADIEHYEQNGAKDDAGSTPATIRVYTRDATGATFETQLSRWDDEPFTVDNRVKKTGSGTNRKTRKVTPKITDKVADALYNAGYDYE